MPDQRHLETSSPTSTTSFSPSVGQETDQIGAATGGLATAPGGGNQAVLDSLSADAGSGALGSAGDVDLDMILGEGSWLRMDGLLQGISDRAVSAVVFLDGPLPCDEWVEPFDGAMNLAEMLETAAAWLTDTATYDEEGEVVCDPELEYRVSDLMVRCETALPILDAVLLLGNQDMIEAFAAALDQFGTVSMEQIDALRLHAESGMSQMQMITEAFNQHQDLYEKYLAASVKDTLSLAIGGMATAFTNLEPLKRAWSVGNAFNTTVSGGDDWWTTAKKLKSIGTASVSEVVRALAAQDPFKVAWGHLGVGITICETIVDLGLTTTELLQMKRLVNTATAVKVEYGPHMAFYAENIASIRAAYGFVSQLSQCSERVAGAVERAEALLAGSNGNELFYPAY